MGLSNAILISLLLGRATSGASPLEDPVCNLVKPQRSHEQNLAAELRLRADPFLNRPEAKELESLFRRHLSCLNRSSERLEAICAEISSREGTPANGTPPFQESNLGLGSETRRCYYLQEVLEMEQGALVLDERIIQSLQRVGESYRSCVNPLAEQLETWTKKQPKRVASELKKSVESVKQFPNTVQPIGALNKEIERRKADAGALNLKVAKARLNYVECQQRNRPIPAIRRVR